MSADQKIMYIDIEKIYQHPKNPRKKLTDIEELADSIRENGIMQNLTVVPWYSQFTGKPGDNGSTEGEYYAVIGHRRLAAAKLAGLNQVPCVISNMDEKQQVAIMLMENMQRSDLTIIEEAEGMQMMFDLGSTADEIAEKTGLSKTTIKRRSQLLELDHEKLVQSYERGGTMQDYLRLQKIKDQEKRNQVLEKIGTNNFDYAVKQAIDEEKDEANKIAIIEMVEEFAEKIDHADHETMRYEKNYRYCIKEHQKPPDWETTNYYYLVGTYQIDLYTDRVEEQHGSSLNHKQRKIEEDREKMRDIEYRIHSLRWDFVKNYPQSKAKKHSGEIIGTYVMMKLNSTGWFNRDNFCKLMQVEMYVQQDIKKIIEESPEKAMLSCLLAGVDNNSGGYSNYYNEYGRNEALDAVYDLLCKLGYEMSDEEKAIKNGTHELYAREEEE